MKRERVMVVSSAFLTPGVLRRHEVPAAKRPIANDFQDCTQLPDSTLVAGTLVGENGHFGGSAVV